MVKLLFSPLLERAMHTPSNAWVRVRSPSTTLTATRTVSPAWNSGTACPWLRRATSPASYCCTMFIGLVLLGLCLGRRCRTGNRGGGIGGAGGGEQVGAALAGDAFGFRQAPGRDRLVVAGQQHVRHAAALPLSGAGVVGVFQQVVGEALVRGAVGRTHHAWQQAHGGVQHHQRRQFAARQYVVADGHFLHGTSVDDALVDALVAAAQQDKAGGGGVAL